MTEKEILMLAMFRNLNRYEQNIVLGKIREVILNKKKREGEF